MLKPNIASILLKNIADLGTKNAARLFGVAPSTVSGWIKRGYIPLTAVYLYNARRELADANARISELEDALNVICDLRRRDAA